jgi:hypothetical protein
MNSIFLQGLAEYYFPGADFGSSPLATILPNIRRFAIKADDCYLSRKGTAGAIEYLLTALFGLDPATTAVNYSNPGIITITSTLDSSYRDFINNHVVPAGVIVIYN